LALGLGHGGQRIHVHEQGAALVLGHGQDFHVYCKVGALVAITVTP
jgi:hypothetical protein